MFRLPALIAACLAAALWTATPLRAAPVLSLAAPAEVQVGDSFTVSARAVGAIEAFELLLDFPSALLASPLAARISVFPDPSGPASESVLLGVNESAALGFFFLALPADYDLLLPTPPVNGAGLYLGAVPAAPLAGPPSEILFEAVFTALAIGSGDLHAGFLALGPTTAAGRASQPFSVVARAEPPAPVGVPGPGALPLLAFALCGLVLARRPRAMR